MQKMGFSKCQMVAFAVQCIHYANDKSDDSEQLSDFLEEKHCEPFAQRHLHVLSEPLSTLFAIQAISYV